MKTLGNSTRITSPTCSHLEPAIAHHYLSTRITSLSCSHSEPAIAAPLDVRPVLLRVGDVAIFELDGVALLHEHASRHNDELVVVGKVNAEGDTGGVLREV